MTFFIFKKQIDIKYILIIYFAYQIMMSFFPQIVWREADTLSISKNFIEESWNIFYPRIDARGGFTGISSSEFPLYSFIVALFFFIFDSYSPVIGKLVTVLFSAGSLFYILKIHLRYIQINPVFIILSAILLPAFTSNARYAMPEIPALFFTSAGTYYLLLFADYYLNSKEKKLSNLVIYCFLGVFFTSFGGLIKPYYLLLCFLLVIQGINIIQRKKITFFMFYVFLGFLILIPLYYWYGYWRNILFENYPSIAQFAFGDFNLMDNIKRTLSIDVLNRIFEQFIKNIMTWYLFPFTVFGVVLVIHKNKMVFNQDLSIFEKIGYIVSLYISPVILILITGDHTIEQPYYFVSATPLLTLCLCVCFAYLDKFEKGKIIFSTLIIVMSMHYIVKIGEQFTHRSYQTSSILKQIKKDSAYINSSKKDLFAVERITSYGLSEHLYYLGRRGWALPKNSFYNYEKMASLKEKGMKYCVFIPTNNTHSSVAKIYLIDAWLEELKER